MGSHASGGNYKAPYAQFDEAPADNYYLMEEGECCCPPGKGITTKEECNDAHDALGLTRIHPWTGSSADVPAGCSNSRLFGAHWNSVVTGKGRNDITAICVEQAAA